MAKLVVFGRRSFIREKAVVFVRSSFIRAKWLKSGKVIVFEQKSLKL